MIAKLDFVRALRTSRSTADSEFNLLGDENVLV